MHRQESLSMHHRTLPARTGDSLTRQLSQSLPSPGPRRASATVVEHGYQYFTLLIELQHAFCAQSSFTT